MLCLLAVRLRLEGQLVDAGNGREVFRLFGANDELAQNVLSRFLKANAEIQPPPKAVGWDALLTLSANIRHLALPEFIDAVPPT